MAPKEKKTYFLFQEGRAPDVLCLGNLVLGDYTAPTVSDHYTHQQLSDDELKLHASSTSFKDRIIHSKQSPSYGFQLSASQIVDSDVSWKASDEIVLAARTGTRVELKNPAEFLNTQVLSRGGEAEKKLKKWLSAANSEYMLKMKWLRRPTIWMCTGLYQLEDTRVFTTSSRSIHTSVGVSPLTISALTDVPIGGSININPETSVKMASASEERLVWAAQYRKLDVKYISLEEDEEPTLPGVLALYKDVTSEGTLRHGSLSDENEPDAVQIEVAAETDGNSGTNEEDGFGKREYYARLHEAILKFEKWGL